MDRLRFASNWWEFCLLRIVVCCVPCTTWRLSDVGWCAGVNGTVRGIVHDRRRTFSLVNKRGEDDPPAECNFGDLSCYRYVIFWHRRTRSDGRIIFMASEINGPADEKNEVMFRKLRPS